MGSKKKKRHSTVRPAATTKATKNQALGATDPPGVPPNLEGLAQDEFPGRNPNPSADSGFRGWAIWLLALALLAGLGLAIQLTRVHLDILYGEGSSSSLCDFGSGFNCSDVVGSEYAKLFGWLPLSVLAIPVYGIMVLLVLYGRFRASRASLGVVACMGALATLFSVYLIYISKVKIGSFCPFCVGMYVIGLLAMLLPAVAMRTSLRGSFSEALEVRHDRNLLRLAPVALAILSSIAWGGYSASKIQLVEKATARALGTEALPSRGEPKASAPSRASQKTQKTSRSTRRSMEARVDLPLDESDAIQGPADAPVTIIVYEDFQCGFCKRLSGNLEVLRERYPEDVRIAFRHFPMHQDCNEGGIPRSMHPNACQAAIASECARQQGQFWPYYTLLFKNFGNLGERDLRTFAAQASMDLEAFAACRQTPEALERVRADTRAAKSLAITGTPTFFINGRRFAGAQSVEVLSALVEAEKQGQALSRADLRKIERIPDVIGTVDAPEMVALEGPYGRFEIDSVEATIDQGRAVARAGMEAAHEVTWFEAEAACSASGKRMCTEAEWITACRGQIPEDRNGNFNFTDDYVLGSSYPYGEHYQPGLCNDQVQMPRKTDPNDPPDIPPLITGNHPQCVSSAGVYDLTGNVREWVGTVPNRAAYLGGAFTSRDSALCGSRVESVGPYHKASSIGFRCCRGGAPTEKVTHPGRQVGQMLSPFKLEMLEGGTFDTQSLQGHVTLLTFWASWCGPCRKELPAYASIYPELEKKGFRLIGINVDRNPKKARRFLDKVPVNFPIVLDTDNSLLETFDTVGMPTSFLINKKGEIVLRKRGYSTGDEKRLKKTVEEMLRE